MIIQLIDKEDTELINKCQKLVEHSYLDNLVLIGDLHSPCKELTRIFGLFSDNSDLVSFFVVFDGFQYPSIVIPIQLENSLLDKIMSFLKNILPLKFLILSLELTENVISNHFKIDYCSVDHCMVLDNQTKLSKKTSAYLKKANSDDLDRIDDFYTAIGASPWNTIQFESDFYHYIEIDNKIVACGGTHFETPILAQLGNIYVIEEYRRRGFGEILTTAITRDILSRKEIATLFVHCENNAAQTLYRKLGFKLHKEARLIFCINECEKKK